MWYLLAPTLVGIVCAVPFWLAGRARRPRLDRRHAVLTATAAGTSSLVMTAFTLSAMAAVFVIPIPAYPWDVFSAIRYLLPVLLGILVVLTLGIPSRSGRSSGAQLTPRTWFSFLDRIWIAITLIVLGIVVAVTVAAGLASERDEAGQFTRYVIELGPGGSATNIYGWHHSVGPLIAVIILLAAAVAALAGIARPPHTEDVEADIARRRLRSTNVARIATGALLLHLATVLRSLEVTSSMSLTVGAASGENFRSGTSFAALTPVLGGGALLAGSIGLALWIVTALSSRSRPTQSAREKVPA
ncbi:hypothetical protein [Brachybacterium sacelli]|uniref:Integral membrane protein n=1 Tax=Brachybacterium sacelli TaxID=173364 RepID=A0ABS4X0B0_9MICO|nr:hypothetical protein [Brachybacterium sacelli]MBP2381776.1 hypothetical protein [Brachybacterium sacelli]